MAHTNPPDDELRKLLTTVRTIAMVGASSNPDKPSHHVAQKLKDAGFRVIPVNPHETEVLGEKAYPSLADVPERIDVVDVFRRPEETPELAKEAVRLGAKALWLQLGITNDEAARTAREGGLTLVMDACLGVAVARLRIRRQTAS